jgi:quinol monooxygenase YgiN
MAADIAEGPVTLLVTVRVREDGRATVRDELRKVATATRQEDGCLIYEVHESPADPDRIIFYERWASPAHLARHQAQDFMARFAETATPYVLGELETVVLEPLS